MNDRINRRYIGWSSVIVGTGVLLAPRVGAQLLGMTGRTGLVRYLGLRDVVVGLGALTQADLTPLVWARAVADASDGLTFAYGLISKQFQRERAAFGILAAIGFTALHVMLARGVRTHGAHG